MVDHLKDIVADHEKYIGLFEIPVHVVNSIRIVNQQSHFMEYFFCILNAHLKSLSSMDPKHSFVVKFNEICDYLEKANQNFLRSNGYAFRLELTVKKNSNRRKKKDHINIPLIESELRKKLAVFFYRLANNMSESTMYTIRLWIDKSKTLGRTGPEEMRSESDEIFENLKFDSMTNEIIKIKDDFKKKLLNKKKKGENLTIDFDYFESVYLDNKKMTVVIDNILVRYLSCYIYKQHMIKKRMGYLPGVIFILLICQMVS